MDENENKSEEQPLVGDKESGVSSEPLVGGDAAEPEVGGSPSVKSVELSEFDDANILSDRSAEPEKNNIDMVLDIPVPIAVELGRTNMALKDVLALLPGSIIELDKLAGDTVDLMIRGKLIAKGEVVVVDDNFGMRITTICGAEERVKHLA